MTNVKIICIDSITVSFSGVVSKEFIVHVGYQSDQKIAILNACCYSKHFFSSLVRLIHGGIRHKSHLYGLYQQASVINSAEQSPSVNINENFHQNDKLTFCSDFIYKARRRIKVLKKRYNTLLKYLSFIV